jgi:hypothetical protein
MALASATAEDNALNGLVTQALYFGVNTGSPGTTGANEATYYSGNRAAITWGSASAGSISNASAALVLNVSSSQTVSYFSTWGASSGTGSGGYQIGGALSSTVTFVTNGTLSVAIGALTLSAS